MIPSTRASSRASARVAAAVVAAVRISVTAEAFRIAVGTPLTPSNATTTPWWASSPRSRGFAGVTTIALSA